MSGWCKEGREGGLEELCPSPRVPQVVLRPLEGHSCCKHKGLSLIPRPPTGITMDHQGLRTPVGWEGAPAQAFLPPSLCVWLSLCHTHRKHRRAQRLPHKRSGSRDPGGGPLGSSNQHINVSPRAQGPGDLDFAKQIIHSKAGHPQNQSKKGGSYSLLSVLCVKKKVSALSPSSCVSKLFPTGRRVPVAAQHLSRLRCLDVRNLGDPPWNFL